MKKRDVLLLTGHLSSSQLKGIARLACECGWRLRTEPHTTPPSNWNGDGVLTTLDGSEPLTDFVRSARRRHIPVVDLAEDIPEVKVPRVTCDNLRIGRLAAEHFNERDFRYAAFFSLTHTCTHDLRFRGFSEAWKGEEVESWLWPDAACGDTDDWHRLDVWLDAKLQKAPKPLAVCCGNDYDAAQLLSVCRRLGVKVPGRVSILGVGNDPIVCEYQRIRLSSVAPDLERAGYAAAATLERLMSGGDLRCNHLHVRPLGVRTRESTETFAVYDREILPAINYITRNLARPLGAAQIAAALKMPRIRLDRLFASRLGHSVGVETARRRLAHAEKLLVETDLPLAAIAEKCGYCHASFFIRTFKKALGTTPLLWRRTHGASLPGADEN